MKLTEFWARLRNSAKRSELYLAKTRSEIVSAFQSVSIQSGVSK